MPSNFRTYEAQSRLLAAVIASHPSLKLNYKDIALHYGSDATEWSINHRFRPIKKHVQAIRKAVAEGQDAKELAGLFHRKGAEIAKHFGESTPQGVEFQFRAIKQNAKALREAVSRSENPVNAIKNAPAAANKPRRGGGGVKRRASPATSDAPAAAAASAAASVSDGPAAPPPAKRARTAASLVKPVFSNDEDGLSEEVDYEELDVTPVASPVMTPVKTAGTAAQFATPSASSTFAPDVTPALTMGNTPLEHETPETGCVNGMHQPLPVPLSFSSSLSSSSRPLRAAGQYPVGLYNGVTDDDNDNDDGVFKEEDNDDVVIIETPSKPPKAPLSASSVPSVPYQQMIPASDAFEPWHSFDTASSHVPSQSYNLDHSTTSSTWAPTDPFSSGEHMSSFSQSVSLSFYDNDGGI